MLLLFVIATPVAFADDEEVGDVASVMNSAAPIPAGHFAMVAKYADQYLSNPAVSPGRAIAITKFDTNALNVNDFYVIDIRGVADYAKGHVPGAVNVAFATIAKPENLVTYPTDRPILVICYTGHTASMTSSILNTLGYNAWVLKGGMPSWSCSSHSCEY
jgi:rhodanese-related sulfurtransferase